MKILIVDDNGARCEEVKALLQEELGIGEPDIYTAYNTQSAKTLMRSIRFDFLILDVVLPKRDEPPCAEFGLALLNDIKKRPTIKKPGKIVGITAQFEDLESFRTQFDSHCEVLIEASTRSKDWKGKILQAVKFENSKLISKYTTERNVTCLSVHGIRTRGEWQQKFKKIVESNVDTVSFESYKYGYFTVLSFMIPFLRQLKVKSFSKELKRINLQGKEIFIFCHSFGTYITVNAISKLLSEGTTVNVKMLVLSGSVLPSNYDFHKIMALTDMKLINDCGCDDRILLLSEGLVPNTGMAGRVGFYGLNNARFVNRFFKGGHSHYFDEGSGFMEKYWLPLFYGDSNIEVIDQRCDRIVTSGIIEKFTSGLGKAKEIIYLTALFFVFYYFWIK
ncbi:MULTISPECIES: response regulator [Enterobacteriaceae]|uniref:response regulator n=1 Tax=Enterobacteriaceae TaxID=543 RepID=UPI0017E4DA2D|nr:response regulator [Lelliottia amnigena]EEW2495581.1 response regulator [Escherichia coli]EFN0095617.1 response regulator [Escherichia coli]MCG7782797.1 response regulator [Lelliottia amnigena]HAH9905372.1 response regulator [Escherichia coli]